MNYWKTVQSWGSHWVPSEGTRGNTNEWGSIWSIKHRVIMTKAILVSQSRIIAIRFPVLCLNDIVFVEYPKLDILSGTFDSKPTFESQRRIVAKSSASQRIGLTRRARRDCLVVRPVLALFPHLFSVLAALLLTCFGFCCWVTFADSQSCGFRDCFLAGRCFFVLFRS